MTACLGKRYALRSSVLGADGQLAAGEVAEPGSAPRREARAGGRRPESHAASKRRPSTLATFSVACPDSLRTLVLARIDELPEEEGTPVPNPFPFTGDATPADGTLDYRPNKDQYVFRWDAPKGLSGCHELWFRLDPAAGDGLVHSALFDFQD